MSAPTLFESSNSSIRPPCIPLKGQRIRQFRTTAGVRQGCLLSPTLYNILLAHDRRLRRSRRHCHLRGRTITNLRFVTDIDGLGGEEEELAKLVSRLEEGSTAYGTEISAEKTKLMTNNISSINKKIKVNGQKLETVTSFKCLGSVVSGEGSKPAIFPRIAQTTAALTWLKPVWNDRNISLNSNLRLMRSLDTSIFL